MTNVILIGAMNCTIICPKFIQSCMHSFYFVLHSIIEFIVEI